MKTISMENMEVKRKIIIMSKAFKNRPVELIKLKENNENYPEFAEI